jgi:hypothetical protein
MKKSLMFGAVTVACAVMLMLMSGHVQGQSRSGLNERVEEDEDQVEKGLLEMEEDNGFAELETGLLAIESALTKLSLSLRDRPEQQVVLCRDFIQECLSSHITAVIPRCPPRGGVVCPAPLLGPCAFIPLFCR